MYILTDDEIQFPRLSYLALLIHKLHTFFSSNLIYPDIQPSDLWLEYEGVPLKWHYPLGLLYDLYSGAEPHHPPSSNDGPSPPSPTQHSSSSTSDINKKTLPWRLTLHASSYPTTHLIPLSSTNTNQHIHDLFIHAVKEADYLRTGTGKTVMFLSQADSQQLWDAVVKHDFSLYNPINQKLLNPQGVNLRHLPVRLYLPHAAGGDGGGASVDEEGKGTVRVVQGLIKADLGSSKLPL
jgi:autophagy-related protein 5